jgi:hypothetical protein
MPPTLTPDELAKMSPAAKELYYKMQGIHNTPPPPNPMRNPRFKVWMRLWLSSRPMKTKTIAKDCRYDIVQTVALLNELGLAGRVAHGEGEWWVVNPLLHPIIE